MASDNVADRRKGTKRRSPNYPAVGLENAVERAKRIYDEDGPAGAPQESALKHMGYSGAHGQAMTVLSALKKFGLVEDRKGRIVPTKLAIDLFEFPADHDRHKNALRSAALLPGIYSQLVSKYLEHGGRLPSDASLKPELIADLGFNPKAVDGFLNDFRESLEYAGLLVGNQLHVSSDVAKLADTGENSDERLKSAEPASAGDMVTIAGTLALPVMVLGVSDDGDWAFLEGMEEARPMSDLTVVERAKPEQKEHEPLRQPPKNPFLKQHDEATEKPGYELVRADLDEGQVLLQWPENLSEASVEEFEYWVQGVLRRLRRKAGLPIEPL